MKNLQPLWGAWAVALLLTFSACQEKETPEEAAVSSTEFTAPAYELEDLDGLEVPEVSAATETIGFEITAAARKDDKHKLAAILRELRLDENQRKAVKQFVEQHQTCMADHHAKIKEIHQQLLSKANAAREELVQAYKSGRITKAQLEEKLQALRARLKEEIAKHELKKPHLRILRKCRQELLLSIQSILNREQLQKWHRWMESHKG